MKKNFMFVCVIVVAVLWLVNQTDWSRTKVGEHRAAEVVALLPALSPGHYALEIVTRYSGGSAVLKEPRTIKAEPVLVAAAP